MSAADVVLIIGAVCALITAVTASIVSLRRVEIAKKEIKQDVQAVHQIVNQQRTDMLAYQKTLVDTLKASGIHVPTDKSLLKE